MTTTAAVSADHVFSLPFYGGFATQTIDAYMLRHRVPGNEDTFSVHAFDDGRLLGVGVTKDEAVSDAQMELAPVAEQMAFEAGRIERPYGPLVRA